MYSSNFRKSVFAFVLGLGCNILAANAQDGNVAGTVTISSPTAASLGEYGDVPVNYHTGIPQINIPVYTVKAGKLELPVGLSYHASGLKVMEYASWVGAGWSLNAGGVITRTVMGSPDDKGYKSYQGFINSTTHGYYSDYGYQSYMMISAAGSVLPSGKMADDDKFLIGHKDGEPDLFFFNFAGYSGKFYFNDDRTPVLVPESDLKIEPEYILGPGFNGFTITTPDGTKYFFGRTGNVSSTADPVELTIPSTMTTGPANASAAASSWFLNKIESADGTDIITFEYEVETYSCYTWSMFPVANYTQSWTTLAQKNGVDLIKNFVNGVRLSRIVFADGTVTFSPSSTPRQDLSGGYTENSGMPDVANTNSFSLGNIAISDNEGFCKKFLFKYSYWEDNTNTDFQGTFWGSNLGGYNLQRDKYCLRLDEVQETACDNSVSIPPYKFNYFDEPVPRRLSFGMDHWGFYNGINNNSGLIPTHFVQFQSVISEKQGANRDAAWPAMRNGSLKKITYPTGGFSEFVFEANNTYRSYNTYTQIDRVSMGAGWDGHNGFLGDGGSNPLRTDYTFSGNQYQIVLSNSSGGGITTLEIYNSSNSLVYNTGSVAAGETKTFTIAFPSGNYWLKLSKNSASTGNGATMNLYEMVPTPVSGNITVGGLRIKSITTNDGATDKEKVTSFNYNLGNQANGNSSGILYSKPAYVKLISNQIFNTVKGNCGVLLCSNFSGGFCAAVADQYYKSPTSVRPMESTQGNHIGYNEVYVSQANNGHSVYRYYGSNHWQNVTDDVCDRIVNWDVNCSAIPNTPAAPVDFEFKRGALKYEGYVNQSGQTLRDIWHYPEFENTPLKTPGYIISSANNNLIATEYFRQSTRKTSDKTEETVYDLASGKHFTITNTIFYSSPYHHLATQSLTYNSKGDELKTNSKYVMDFRIAACDNLDNGISTYETNSTSAQATFYNTILTCTPQGPSVPLTTNCRYIAYQQLREDIANCRIQFIQTRRTNFTDASNNFNANHLTAKNAAGSELKPILELQDAFQNGIVEQSQWKEQNFLGATFTRFEYSNNVPGKIFPDKIQAIKLTIPSGTFTSAAVSGNTIAKDSRYLDETSLSFAAGKLAQSTKRGGKTDSYIWDYSNGHPIAKISNATHDQVAYASFESDGKGSWVFTGSGVADASAPTGKKSFSLTSGSITRSGLNSSASYYITYWAKNQSGTVQINSGSGTQLIEKNGWTLYQYKITGTASVNVSGTAVIDELRLFPENSQMITYSYQPLIGMTAVCDVNNRIIYYEHDGLGRLKMVRDHDKNILEKFDYQYQIFTHNNPVWVTTGNIRCKPCPANSVYITNITQNEEKDTNPYSTSYDQLRWVDAGMSSSCVINVDWQFTATAIRCKLVSGDNTGEQEREQKDMNPCSPTYDQLRWIVTGTDLNACPIPCNYSNCESNGPDWSCINGICEQGIKVYHSSIHVGGGLWWCYYHYEFSDGSWSTEYEEDSPVNCVQ